MKMNKKLDVFFRRTDYYVCGQEERSKLFSFQSELFLIKIRRGLLENIAIVPPPPQHVEAEQRHHHRFAICHEAIH